MKVKICNYVLCQLKSQATHGFVVKALSAQELLLEKVLLLELDQ
ncbi:hypothetical protein AM1_0375 [Acaryochloris marina MBIC11017]|uniref:Uncharacterized protein n=1 Tax=Acaryochloris marina (strain MBIC 11017) TaxID=329726 RepID=B0C9Z2_ACAM1|nr:hypothetical protein AM1_0375 [Acaryochloris marina MBIC11017]